MEKLLGLWQSSLKLCKSYSGYVSRKISPLDIPFLSLFGTSSGRGQRQSQFCSYYYSLNSIECIIDINRHFLWATPCISRYYHFF